MTVSLRLVVDPGPGVGEGAVFLLTGQDAILGRDESCDLVIESPTVSGRHGMLRAGALGYDYTDLDSRNGSALVRGGAPAAALPGGSATPLGPGDVLLLGAADTPVRIRIEAGTAPFLALPAMERTVLARAPLSDLLSGAPDGLVALAARALAAQDGDALAESALAFLAAVLPQADGRAVLITGAGLSARAGDPLPAGLSREAASRREVVLFEQQGERLPMTESIARSGMRAAVVAPLYAGESWHGLLAAWTSRGPTAIPTSSLSQMGVAASLLALAAGMLTVRRQGDEARRRLADENQRLRGGPEPERTHPEPIGSAPGFLEAVALCRTVAPASVPVLILGETGTGKEVLARAVHRWSPRAKASFVAFNCAALPESLLESELFGHVRGAFTGAGTDKKGLFEEAHGGTIFLDEIGELAPSMQAKLLRVLQDGEVRRVGATRSTVVDVRVVSATNRDLRTRVEQGQFRADLLYRLNAVTVRIPALRDRGDDVTLLAHHLLGRAARKARKKLPGFAPEALWALASYEFPGNVRELENEVVRAVALTDEGHAIRPEAFSEAIAERRPADAPSSAPRTLHEAVSAAERQAVESAIGRPGGNVSAAARELGLTRPGLYKVMERLGLRGE